MSSLNRIRLGVLGCGAITAGNHLPAAVAHPQVRITDLVDQDLGRARMLRRRYRLDCDIHRDFKAVLNKVDAVLIALPNYLHAPVIAECVQAGVSVLCEKPLATSAKDAETCVELAERHGILLAVGMQWRFWRGSLLLGLALQDGLLGPLLGYEWEHGHQWEWDGVFGSYFSRAQAGGGVLIDTGVHLLDCLIQWFGEVIDVEYQDDNWGGGIESNAAIRLQHSGALGEVYGQVRLSRTFNLKNRLVVRGEQKHAELRPADRDLIFFRHTLCNHNVTEAMRLDEVNGAQPSNPFYAQLDSFVRAIRGAREPLCDGRQAVKVMQLIERCYSEAGRIPEPWSEIQTL